MKKAVIVFASAMLFGCTATNPLVEQTMVSRNTNIFQNVSEDIAEMASIEINASLKTHTSSYHLFEGRVRGTKDYTLVLNIDGQSVPLVAEPTVENLPDPNKANAEGGKGIRYIFKKNLLLKPGSHKLTIAAPTDNAATEKTIQLRPGANTLVIEPIYNKIGRNKILHFRGDRHFTQHVRSFAIKLNGKDIDEPIGL